MAALSGTVATQCVRLTPSMLPPGESEFFRDSSYYQWHSSELPTPSEVFQAVAEAQRLETKPRRKGTVVFRSLGLLVKYGKKISISEGQCLWVLRNYTNGAINVPEVYGWQTEGENTFIFMELLEGDTLQEKWEDLSWDEKESICTQLGGMISSWRSFEQDPRDKFIGRIDRQPLLDRLFEYQDISENPSGPFTNAKSFHDWFVRLGRPAKSKDLPPNPYRADLSDDEPIVFTHGDLHPSNIIICPEGADEAGRRSFRVSVIDWHQSGWLPRRWESCKASYSVDADGEWSTVYLPKLFGQWGEKKYDIAWQWFSLPLI